MSERWEQMLKNALLLKLKAYQETLAKLSSRKDLQICIADKSGSHWIRPVATSVLFDWSRDLVYL